jgi:O-acetyl-ADP-ribose deacetylase (regulator of RNase III)
MFKMRNRLCLDMSIQPISDFYGDAIVIPTSPELDWDSDLITGVRQRAGGSVLERAKTRGPIERGEALATTGGGLLATFLIYVAIIPSCDKLHVLATHAEEELLEKAITNSFLRCSELRIENVGMPNLGKYLGFGDRQSARIILRILCEESLLKMSSLREVHLVLESDEELKAFGEVACACSA